MIKKNRSFSLKFWLLLLIGSISSVLLISQYALNYRFVKDLQREHIKAANKIISFNIETMMLFPVVTKDKAELKRISDNLLLLEGVWSIETWDNAEELLYKIEKESDNGTEILLVKTIIPIFDQQPAIALNQFAEEQNDLVDKIKVGEVRVYFANEPQVNILEKTLFNHTIVAILIIFFVAVILLYWILIVTRFIQHAKAQMIQIDSGNYKIRVGRTRISEFNDIACHIENMAKTFDHQVIEIINNQEKAIEGQKMAEHHSYLKTELMGLISDKIRTPVEVIYRLFSSLDENQRGKNTQEYITKLEICKKAAVELLSVVEELLDFNTSVGGYSILIIDDREKNCLKLSDIFKEQGLQVQFSTDPHNAPKKVAATYFDVMLVSNKMHGVDIISFVKQLRQKGQNPNVVIICVTTNATLFIQDDLLQPDIFDGLLIEPVEPANLLEKIEQTLMLREQLTKFQAPNDPPN